MFKNWKTTIGGMLTGGPIMVCQLFHLCTLGHLGTTDWFAFISGVGALILGATAKDNNVTGGTVHQ